MAVDITIGWPQIIYLAWMLFGLGAHAVYHGRQVRVNFVVHFIGSIFGFVVLYWGGFF